MFRVYRVDNQEGPATFNTRAEVWKYLDEDLADVRWDLIRVDVFREGVWNRLKPSDFSIKFGVQ